jgi:hypothetical protein
MDIFVDIDDTICKTKGLDYKIAVPLWANIQKINELYDKGHNITYWTARGVKTKIDHRELTEFQLEAWGCKYHKLKLTKEPFDLLIDDKCINSSEFFNEDIEY